MLCYVSVLYFFSSTLFPFFNSYALHLMKENKKAISADLLHIFIFHMMRNVIEVKNERREEQEKWSEQFFVCAPRDSRQFLHCCGYNVNMDCVLLKNFKFLFIKWWCFVILSVMLSNKFTSWIADERHETWREQTKTEKRSTKIIKSSRWIDIVSRTDEGTVRRE